MLPSTLQDGLRALGELLADEGLGVDLVLIGAGALFLLGELDRPTGDLDAVARMTKQGLQAAKPFDEVLIAAIRRVGRALDLPHQPRDDKDWLNDGPSFLTDMGLPPGFESRLTTKQFNSLTIRLAARVDLIALKFFAATDIRRAHRRKVDIADLKALNPTIDEMKHAVDWCAAKDGRDEFVEIDALPVLKELGINLDAVR